MTIANSFGHTDDRAAPVNPAHANPRAGPSPYGVGMVPDEERDEPRGLLRRRRRRPVDAAGLTGPEARARAAWDDLCNSSMLRRGGGQLLVMDGSGDTAGICPSVMAW